MKTVLAALLCSLLLLASGCMGDDGGSDNEDDTATSTPGAAATTARADGTATTTTGANPVTPTTTRAATNTPARATVTPNSGATATAQADSTATAQVTEPAGGATATQGGGQGTTDLPPAVAAELEEVENTIAEVRGLELKQDVQVDVLSREELGADLLQQLEEDYPQETADQDTIVYWLLRLIDDPTIDLHQLYVDLYSERVLGYYDPETDQLVLVDEAGTELSPLAETTMAHELTHALQDQYYDLETLRPEDIEADRGRAITGLLEGDAEIAQTLYLLQHMDPDEMLAVITESQSVSSAVLESAPPFIRDDLQFPYLQGAEFAAALYQSGGYELIDQAYADPPTSSEQILHPEKYTDTRDDPTELEIPDITATLGAGWTQATTNTIGEFEFQVLFRENGVTEYEGAAAGWDGSRFALYTNGDASLVTLNTVWDSEAEATEAAAALRSMAGTAAGTTSTTNDGQGRFSTIWQDGASVYLVVSTDEAAVGPAADALGG